jgi:hypothetical protein
VVVSLCVDGQGGREMADRSRVSGPARFFFTPCALPPAISMTSTTGPRRASNRRRGRTFLPRPPFFRANLRTYTDRKLTHLPVVCLSSLPQRRRIISALPSRPLAENILCVQICRVLHMKTERQTPPKHSGVLCLDHDITYS